jgi:hypothetical protein
MIAYDYIVDTKSRTFLVNISFKKAATSEKMQIFLLKPVFIF